MRRWFELLPRAVSAVAIAVGSLALPAPALSVVPSGQETAVGVPPRVTMISDSTGAILFWSPEERERLAQGLDFQLQAMACRKLVSPGCYAYDQIAPSVLDTVESLGRDLGSIVIVDIGYNDEAEGYGAGLDSVMHALASAGVEHVIWLTLKRARRPGRRSTSRFTPLPHAGRTWLLPTGPPWLPTSPLGLPTLLT